MIGSIVFYLYVFFFTYIFAMYTKYQFQDEKLGFANSKGLWHKYGLIMKALFVMAFPIAKLIVFTWKDFFLVCAIEAPLWDILVNVYALDEKWNYEGTTAETDKAVSGTVKWICYSGILIGAIVIKFTY